MFAALLAPITLLSPLQLSPEYSVSVEIINSGTAVTELSACVSIADWITIADFIHASPDCSAQVEAAVGACAIVDDPVAPTSLDYDATRYLELDNKYRALELEHTRVGESMRMWRYIAVGASSVLLGVTIYLAVDR